jgi:GNAT superfamily N-acetyltransferase
MMIRLLEELTLNTVPALQVLHYDGWVIRFANGYTRRANSIVPLYESRLPLADKIAHCESICASVSRPTIFKLTDAAQPPELDSVLAARGYVTDASRVSVQTCSLVGYQPVARDLDIRLEPRLTDTWLEGFHGIKALEPAHIDNVRRMFSQIIPRSAFVSLWEGSRIVAAGLGVCESGYLGLLQLIVDETRRGRGLGTALVDALLMWGIEQGAHTAYLQMELSNTPAQRLYSKLGFVEQYQYWYRVKD